MAKLLSAIFLSLITAQAFAQSPTVLGKTVEDWQRQFKVENTQDRHLAAWALAQFGSIELAGFLLEGAEDPVVAYWAVQGLGKAAAGKLTVEQRANACRELITLLAIHPEVAAVHIAAAEQLA